MLSGKNIVVTGCLQEIGKETLIKFAENGANVFACAYQKNDDFEELCRGLSQTNEIRVIPVYFDLMDNLSIKEAAKEIQKTKMEIHGLVNVAGINKDAFFNMITYQDMLDTFQVNVYSQIIWTQYIVKLMLRHKTRGSIAFASSITALDGNMGQVTYGASKAALIGAMKSMALELGANDIRVNAVCPGVIKMAMTEKLDSGVIEKMEKAMEIPRLGEAGEVADVFMYLMSDLSTHVSGQILRVDGGIGS